MKILLLLTGLLATATSSLAAQDARIVVNGRALSPETIRSLEGHYRVRMAPGVYWYDPASGAWGLDDGPTAGLILPGLELGGSLREDASAGTTLVWVNGRRLPWQDVLALQQITGPILPGRYWLDAEGNAGYEGGPALVNLRQISARSRGSAWSHYTRASDASVGGDGDFFYYIDRDVSVTGGNE